MDSAQASPRVRRQARQARSQATETALLDAGLAHFAEQGFDGLSMSAVAERAGTSIGALYFRFGDREGFVQALLQRGFDGIRQETDALLAKAIAAHQSPTEVIGAFIDLAVRGAPTLLGLLSGMVGGLVAITPAAGFVQPGAAVAIGLIAGALCFWGATWLKRQIGVDDSLDVFGVYAIGGIAGSLLTGVFAEPLISGVKASLFNQGLAVAVVAAYSAAVTALILFVIRLVTPLRVTPDTEAHGLDLAVHMERQHQ